MPKFVAGALSLGLAIAIGTTHAGAQAAGGGTVGGGGNLASEVATALGGSPNAPTFYVSASEVLLSGGSTNFGSGRLIEVATPAFNYETGWSNTAFTGLTIPPIISDDFEIYFDTSFVGPVICPPAGPAEDCIPKWCLVALDSCCTQSLCAPPDTLLYLKLNEALTPQQTEGLTSFVAGIADVGLGCYAGAGTCDLLSQAATLERLQECLANPSCFGTARYDWLPDAQGTFVHSGLATQ